MVGALLLTVSPLAAREIPGRISSRVADLGEVMRVYLAEGLASMIQLPYPITEVRLGEPR